MWIRKGGRICRPCEHLNWEANRIAEGRDPHYIRRKPRMAAAARARKIALAAQNIDYEQMFVSQEGVCKICQQPERRTRKGLQVRLSIDHSHATGKVRGLLCYRCNVALGFLQDDPVRLQRAVEYLQNSTASEE